MRFHAKFGEAVERARQQCGLVPAGVDEAGPERLFLDGIQNQYSFRAPALPLLADKGLPRKHIWSRPGRSL